MEEYQFHKTFSDEEKIVFEEINRWHRYIISTLWLVTFFFISLNFLIIHVVSKESIFNALRQSVRWGLVFTGFCGAQYIISLVMLIASVNLARLISKKNNNSLQIEKLIQALESKGSDFLSIEKICKAIIKTTWGILSTTYAGFFIAAWWILVYN